MNGFHDRGTVRSRTRCGSSSESTGSDGDHASGAYDFDVVAWDSRLKARALQSYVVAHIAEGLIVEDENGSPAFEVDSCSDTCRASNGDL